MPQPTRSKIAFFCLWLLLFIYGAVVLLSLSSKSIDVVEAVLAILAAVFGLWRMIA